MSCGAPISRAIRHRDHLQLIPDLDRKPLLSFPDSLRKSVRPISVILILGVVLSFEVDLPRLLDLETARPRFISKENLFPAKIS